MSIDVGKVEQGDLLVQDLGQNVDTNVKLASGTELGVLLAESLVGGLVQHDLSKDLVGEGARHDEGRVTSGTSEVDETTLSQKDDVSAVLHQVAVDLGLDVLDGLGIGLEPGNVNLNVEVTNVYTDELAFSYKFRNEIRHILQTMASFFMTSKCSPMRISLQPVVVTKI